MRFNADDRRIVLCNDFAASSYEERAVVKLRNTLLACPRVSSLVRGLQCVYVHTRNVYTGRGSLFSSI